VAKTAQGLKGKVPKNKFVLPIKSWIFIFFDVEAFGSSQKKLQVP
jgi:hypothetical protein